MPIKITIKILKIWKIIYLKFKMNENLKFLEILRLPQLKIFHKMYGKHVALSSFMINFLIYI